MNECGIKEVVDLYAKLVIGTFSFIGPSFTLFISLFQKQIESYKKKNIQVAAGLAKTISNGGSNKAVKKALNKIDREQRLSNPKRQVKRLFGTLLGSIILIGVFYFEHSPFCQFKIMWIRIITISASGALFIYSLIVFWQIFDMIINAKVYQAQLELDKQSTLQTSKNSNNE